MPDPRLPPSAHLDPWLDVQVTGVEAGWTRVFCANGWAAWVNGSALVARESTAAARAGAAPTVSSPAVSSATIGPTTWMAIGGGVAVALSAFLPWVSFNFGTLGTVSANAFKAPLELLWNVQASPLAQGTASPLTVGLALVAMGAVAVAVVFMGPALDLARRAAGGLAVLIASDFVRQLSTAVGRLNQAGNTRTSVLSLLGIGVYVALAGGALILIGTGRKRAAVRP